MIKLLLFVDIVFRKLRENGYHYYTDLSTLHYPHPYLHTLRTGFYVSFYLERASVQRGPDSVYPTNHIVKITERRDRSFSFPEESRARANWAPWKDH